VQVRGLVVAVSQSLGGVSRLLGDSREGVGDHFGSGVRLGPGQHPLDELVGLVAEEGLVETPIEVREA